MCDSTAILCEAARAIARCSRRQRCIQSPIEDSKLASRAQGTNRSRGGWVVSADHRVKDTHRSDAPHRCAAGIGPGSHAVLKSPPGPKTHRGNSPAPDPPHLALLASIADTRSCPFAVCSVFSLAERKPNVKGFLIFFHLGSLQVRWNIRCLAYGDQQHVGVSGFAAGNAYRICGYATRSFCRLRSDCRDPRSETAGVCADPMCGPRFVVRSKAGVDLIRAGPNESLHRGLPPCPAIGCRRGRPARR